MTRLQNLFGRKNKNLLSVYFTAGYPTIESIPQIINELDRGGADMIEVGVPFSDPMADGPVIQHSSTVALRQATTLKMVLEGVAQARKQSPDIPLILMGYLNPMLQYGIESLFIDAKEAGIDAFIIPDLPFEEYLRVWKPLCDCFQMPLIMLVTPESEPDRIAMIDANCDGFIYVVSSASTTGTRDSYGEEQLQYFERLDSMGLRLPRLIGFGISNRSTLSDVWKHSSGGIVGSLFIKKLGEYPDNIPMAVSELMKALS